MGDGGSWDRHFVLLVVENDIPSFFIGFITCFNTVIRKQIITMRGAGAATSQYG